MQLGYLHRSGDDEDLALQAVGKHIDGIFDPTLSVDLKLLYQGVQNLPILRQFKSPGYLKATKDILALDLLVLAADAHHTGGGVSDDIFATDTDDYLVDLGPCLEFS